MGPPRRPRFLLARRQPLLQAARSRSARGVRENPHRHQGPAPPGRRPPRAIVPRSRRRRHPRGRSFRSDRRTPGLHTSLRAPHRLSCHQPARTMAASQQQGLAQREVDRSGEFHPDDVRPTHRHGEKSRTKPSGSSINPSSPSTAAKPEQTLSQLDAILPWLNHDEWWFLESATIALSPALQRCSREPARCCPPSPRPTANATTSADASPSNT